jgi:phosphate transport system protein
MLQELLSLFRTESPLKALTENFSEMLTISHDNVKKAGSYYFAQTLTPEERSALKKADIRVNKLQRKIRKQVIFHLSMESNTSDLPYCLLLTSLVKDVERIGDYAKEIADLIKLSDDVLPEDPLLAEFKEIRSGVETDFGGAIEVMSDTNRERAIELIECGKDTVERCEQLISKLAKTSYSSGITVSLTLGVRYYQRIAEHVLNLLSSVVMPLHKLDYYDEKDIAKAEKKLG